MICSIRKKNQCLAHGKLFTEHHNHDENNRRSVTSGYTGYENKRIPFVDLSLPRVPILKREQALKYQFSTVYEKEMFVCTRMLIVMIQYNMHNNTVSLNKSSSFSNSGVSQSINIVCVTLETDSLWKVV